MNESAHRFNLPFLSEEETAVAEEPVGVLTDVCLASTIREGRPVPLGGGPFSSALWLGEPVFVA